MRVSRLLPVLVALAFLAIPALASASTLTNNGGTYSFTGSGAVNSMSVNASPGSIGFADVENIAVSGTSAGSCTGNGTTSVTCTTAPVSIATDFGGGNDTGNVNVLGFTNAFPVTGQGGAGDDQFTINTQFSNGTSTLTLDDSSGNDTLQTNGQTVVAANSVQYGTVNGGIGDDLVVGNDLVNGNGGNDTLRAANSSNHAVTLDGGTENDLFLMDNGSAASEIVKGGSGTDTVDYASASAVVVSLDTALNDGPKGAQTDNANADGSVEILKGTADADSLTGGVGNDTIFGRSGDDTINGAGGDDFIDGQGGADVMNGGTNGAGGDTVDYSTRAAPLRVSPDGVAANDGEAGEFDNVGGDVENLVGGFNNDSFGGNASANNYNGGLGDDTIDGGTGNDILTGGSGRDQIDGGPNTDAISGGPGDDTIDAGLDNDTSVNGDAGADLVDGNLGADTISGGDGSDTMLSREPVAAPQADTVNCGSGTDHSVHDAAGDTINADCEISDTGSAGFGIGTNMFPGVTAGSNSQAVLTCISSRAKRTGRVKVKCTVALADKSNALVRAKLLRKGHVVARTKRHGSGALTMRTAKHAKKGRYRIVITRAGRAIARAKVTVK
jgi:Ca2+-binding RTX toxin-like protein